MNSAESDKFFLKILGNNDTIVYASYVYKQLTVNWRKGTSIVVQGSQLSI